MDRKELFLKQKEAEHKGTVAIYAKIPRDRLGWRPAEGMLTLGQMAPHVWRSEEGVFRIAIDGDWNYYAKRIREGIFATLGEVKSLDEELREIGRVHRATLHAAQAFPLDRWEEIRANPEYRTHGAAGVILFRIIEHHIHHRAQVGTYIHILTGGKASPYAD